MFFFTFIKKTVKKHAKNIKLQYPFVKTKDQNVLNVIM